MTLMVLPPPLMTMVAVPSTGTRPLAGLTETEILAFLPALTGFGFAAVVLVLTQGLYLPPQAAEAGAVEVTATSPAVVRMAANRPAMSSSWCQTPPW